MLTIKNEKEKKVFTKQIQNVEVLFDYTEVPS